MASNSSFMLPPVRGCSSDLDSLYHRLCDLNGVWGIVLEAFAAAGVVSTLILLVVLLASVPFMADKNRKSSLGLHTCFLVFTLGLFCLTFAFIVDMDFSTCASRRFLFGVLFGGCFACLLTQCVKLNILARQNHGPNGWVLCLGALGLWLVEVVINTEWLIITIVRYPLLPANATANVLPRAQAVPCNIGNEDFAMALIYVMALLLSVVVASLPTLVGKNREWASGGAFILVTGLVTVGIWVAWIVMYVYGNRRKGGPTWDDPTLAIALVANAWVFLILYVIPEICSITTEEEDQPGFGEEFYPNRGVGYETILKEQSSHNMFVENKAFSMDEPGSGQKPVSPYSGYSGQLRSSVYQPTELALMGKGIGNSELSYETSIPRATAHSPAPSGSSTASVHTERHATAEPHTFNNNVNGLHKTQW